MKTIPGPQTIPASSTDFTWNVMRSNFPFGIPNKRLGEVHAADKRTAQLKAEDHYGRDVVVERQTLKNVEKQEAR